MINSGDKYANEVFNKFNKTPMIPFPSLSEKDIEDILAYTTNPPAEVKADPKAIEEAAKKSAAAVEAEQKKALTLKSLWFLF